MIYLDNAATTKPSRRAMKAAIEAMDNDWCNPSSLYDEAKKTSEKIERSRQIIADLIEFKPHQITFTSGATEANNMVTNQDWDYVLYSEIEHDSISNSVPEDKRIPIPVDYDGSLMLATLDAHLHMLNGKCLVSVMAVNNEIGTIQSLGTIADIVHSRPNCYLHIDATQAMGKMILRYNLADYVTASAHKFHGLKGVGFIAHKHPLEPLIKGGHQENELRAGTENTVGIISMAEALQECYDSLIGNDKLSSFSKVIDLNHLMCKQLKSISKARFNSEGDNPYIINISFKDINAEALLHMLSLKGICVSSGSACNSKSTDVSKVLRAIDVPKDYIYGTIRISFDENNTFSEVEEAGKEIALCVKTLRKMKEEARLD